MDAGHRWAALGVAVGLGLAGCAGDGESGAQAPAPRPAPSPEPPPPPTVTWIGFASPTEVEVFAGSRTRVSVTVAGEPLDAPFDLRLDHEAPAESVLIPDEVRVEQRGHGAFEIERPPASGFEAASRHEVVLRAPEDGLPAGVALSGNRGRLGVTLPESDPHGCSGFRISATAERFDRRGGFSSAQLRLEGPEHVAIRFPGPYWDDRFEAWDEPPDLPIQPSDAAPVSLVFPDAMPYQSAGGGGHSQRVSLAWYEDLELEAVAPGCAPIRLRCPVETILTQGCRG